MFKRLRERITEEAITRFPVGQYGLNQSPGRSSLDPSAVNTENVSEDLITLSDSSSVVVPHTSPQQFSIADEDGSFSEPNTPQKLKMDCSAGSEQFCTPNSTADELQQISPEAHVLPKYQPSNKKSYVPQSDIESEVEEPPTLRLDGISKEQLTMANEALKAKMYKYKQKYSEVVVKYKELNDEKVKIEHILTESQDKALRRIAELKEQCQLEQNAKAHLEENLRLILEEKEDMISVLQTKINLLKDGINVDNAEVVSQSSEKRELKIPIEKTDGDSREPEQSENLALKEKITRLQALLEKCKSTIKDNKEKMSSLIKENETISQILQEKSNELEEMKGKEMDYQDQLHNMQLCLKEHEEQQEESAMSMAETKKNMHEELEIKEQQLRKAKEELRTFQMSMDAEKQTLEDFKKQHEEAVNELQSKLKNTEKAMEEEKQNLMHELSRGKAAAVALMQQECAKKLLLAEVDWEAKLKEVQIQKEKNFLDKEKDMSDKLLQNEAVLKKYDLELEKLNSELKQLKCEKQHTKIEKDVNTENLVFEKEQALKYIEAELSLTKSTYMKDIEGLKTKIAQLETLNANLEIEKEDLQASRLKMENVIEELKLEMTSTMKCKEIEYEKIQTERDEYLSVLSETIKDRENIILQLKSTLSSTEISHQEKMHELNDRIKQLEFQQEKLMLQAQERVSTTETECREIVDHLKEKISILQSEKLDTEVLKSEIRMLNSQVEQSILDSETNQFAFTEELSSLRSQLNDVKKVLSNTLETHAVNESELLNKLKKLESENLQFLEDRKCLDVLKEEKEHLNQKLKDLEEKSYTEPIMEEIALLKEENVRLQREVELLAPLKSEKELLNEKISLENNKKDLSDKIIQVEVQNNQLSTSASDDIFNVKLVSLENELTSVKEENFLLLNKIHLLEQNTPYDPNSAYFKQYVDLIKSEFEGKLSMKDTEMETKLKQLVKDFCGQLNVKDKDYDQVISEIIEKSQCQEEQLLRNHRIEIASLRQDIFEKDCALEEMREHYEEIVQEKDAKLKEYGSIWKAGNPSNFDLCPEIKKGEHSDWDDGWVVCEENTENASSLHCNKTECAVHVHQIDELQEEVAKCNSEIKDLRILLCLNPPQSPSSNNNYSNSLPCLPEPTEFEYLRNILFEYMMGKETLTLVKVIAAVLRFSEEQTQLVLQKEELRRTMK